MKCSARIRWLCLFTAICLLLSGCSLRIDPPGFSSRPTQSAAPDTSGEPEPPHVTEPMPDTPFPAQNYPDAVDFGEMEYVRPDVDALLEQIDALTQTVTDGSATAEELLDALYALDEPYDAFNTMDAVAYIRYCLNLSDDYYNEEYNYLENQNPVLQASLERLYIACADSPHKDALEEYFGEDFLDFYLTHQAYSNEEFVALAQTESDLQARYMALQDAPTVTFDGKEQDFQSLCEEYADDPFTLYNELFPAYFEQYGALCGEIFVQLIQTRQQMAQAAGYSSYADFMFDFYYQRDYTPAQARQYVTDLRQALLSVYEDAVYEVRDYEAMSMDDAAATLAKSLNRMNPDYYEYFQFMEHFHLWDTASSASKMPGSYQTYLYSYDEPFLYLSPDGTERDYMTLAHEFGHFIDAMENDGQDTALEQCEIFSQSMEFLTLFYCDLPEQTVEELKDLKLLDLLEVLLFQGAYAEFEDRVYQLQSPALEDINDTYQQVMTEYGLYVPDLDWYNRQGWIDISHFFIAPCYIISYCVSADPALQIFKQEQEHSGAGVETYAKLLRSTVDCTFTELMEQCGLESPFQPGRAKELAELFRHDLS